MTNHDPDRHKWFHLDLDVAVCDKSQTIDRFTQTVVIIVPLTSNLLRSNIPGTFTIPAEEGGLTQESVALCYQIAVIDLQPTFR